MEIKVDRRYKKPTYTISNVFIDGEWFCNFMEDRDRGLTSDMSLAQIRSIKVAGETAIPSGRYAVTLKVKSPKYAAMKTYASFCGGYMPRLLDVTGFDGILIHPGNYATDTQGCLLPGLNKRKGAVLDSVATFKRMYERLKAASDRNEKIYITIS